MAHMVPWVDKGPIVVIETDNGSEVIPCDVCGEPPMRSNQTVDLQETPSPQFRKRFDEIKQFVGGCRDYLEGSRPREITFYASVWYGRYSAPGYMDATSWSWNRNRRELEKELREMYGDNE